MYQVYDVFAGMVVMTTHHLMTAYDMVDGNPRRMYVFDLRAKMIIHRNY